MSQNNTPVQNTITVYCCGGAGIGIGKYFEAERKKSSTGYARIAPVYMDSSKASTFGVQEEYFYHLPGKENDLAGGSGGVRGENAEMIIEHTREILQKFPPADYSILIHSSTGGSGSMFGPSIASELLRQGKTVIVFVVSSDDTLQFLENTIGTMASYDSIADVRQRGVVMKYLQNGKDGTVEEVDTKVHVMISMLMVMLSGQNRNLDGQDVSNMFNFSKVTSFKPQVAILTIHHGKMEAGSDSLISAITLNDSLNDTRLPQPVEYQRVGVPHLLAPPAEGQRPIFNFPLNYVLTDGYLDTVMKDLRRQVKEYNNTAASRVIRNKLSTGEEVKASNGMVW